MSNKGLVLTGTRPPSVTDFRPRTAPSVRGRYGYHTVGIKSNVDETLFKSHNPGRMSEEIDFKPPWSYKKKTPEEQLMKPKGRPLMWAPQPSVSLDGNIVSNHCGNKTKNTNSNSTQSKHKLWRHTPTFVDESLFGPRLEEPSFDAPWGMKKTKARPYFWVPDPSLYDDLENTESAKKTRYRVRTRPKTAQGTRSGNGLGNSRPIWKPWTLRRHVSVVNIVHKHSACGLGKRAF